MILHDSANILLDLEVNNKVEVLEEIVKVMYKNGYIKKGYLNDVLEREEIFPTGLPTEGVKIAIPHASSNSIVKSGVGVAVLRKPVVFNNMVEPEEELEVEIVFLLANMDKNEQVKELQKLMDFFSEGDTLLKIKKASSVNEIVDILNKSNKS